MKLASTLPNGSRLDGTSKPCHKRLKPDAAGGQVGYTQRVRLYPRDYKLGGGSFIKPLIFSELCVAFRSFVISAVAYLLAKLINIWQSAKTFPQKSSIFLRKCPLMVLIQTIHEDCPGVQFFQFFRHDYHFPDVTKMV